MTKAKLGNQKSSFFFQTINVESNDFQQMTEQ